MSTTKGILATCLGTIIGLAIIIPLSPWMSQQVEKLHRHPSSAQRAGHKRLDKEISDAVDAYARASAAAEEARLGNASDDLLRKVDALGRAAHDAEKIVQGEPHDIFFTAPEDLRSREAKLQQIDWDFATTRADLSEIRWRRMRTHLSPIEQVFAPVKANTDSHRITWGDFDTALGFYHFDENAMISKARDETQMWIRVANDRNCRAIADGESVKVIRTETITAGELTVERMEDTIMTLTLVQFKELARVTPGRNSLAIVQ